MIKVVLQTLSLYCIGVHLIPEFIVEEIHMMLNAFWWGSQNNSRKGVKWMC